jgi:hypothetical protein
MTDPDQSTSRAVVITAAFASALRTLVDGVQGQRLEQELEEPTFKGMDDSDIAVLLQRAELELHKRGWRPLRQWERAEEAQV